MNQEEHATYYDVARSGMMVTVLWTFYFLVWLMDADRELLFWLFIGNTFLFLYLWAETFYCYHMDEIARGER